MIRRLKHFVAAAALLAITLAGPLGPYLPKASASPDNASLGNVSPLPTNSGPNDGEHVHFIRKQGQFAGIQPNVELKIYYPSDVTQWNQLYVQLGPGSPVTTGTLAGDPHNYICDKVTTGMSAAEKKQFIRVTFDSLNGGGNNEYDIPASGACDQSNRQNADSNAGAAAQANNQFYARYQLPSKPTQVDPKTGRYIVHMSIKYGVNVPTDPDQGIRFVVRAPFDASLPSNNDALIGQLGNGVDENFSILADWQYHDDNGGTRITIPFGQCNANNGIPQDQNNVRVSIYDSDNGFFPSTVNFKVKNMDTGNYVGFSGRGSDNAGPGSWGNAAQTDYIPPDGSGKAVGGAWAIMPTFKANVHYQLEIYGIATRNTIDIGLPGDAVYGVLRCQNMLNPQMSCSVSVTPSDISTGDTVQTTVRGQASGYGGNPPTQVKLGTTSPTNVSQVVGPIPTDPNLNSYKATFNSIAGAPGIYTVDAYATDVNPGTGGKDLCPEATYVVTSKPYVSVYGGDAAAGVSPQYDGTAFSSYTNAAEPGGFVGWNDNDGSGSWGSAGAQWAVQAIGGIYGFASARGVTPGTPQYLSFTNTTNVSGNSYGGLYDGTGGVKLDYASDISKAAPADVHVGDTVLPGGIVGTQTVVVNNGDAYLSGALKYGSTTWATTQAIPSYKLIVVGGDIYVDKSVNQLDGTYVAIPKVLANGSTIGGNVYTCSAKILNTFVRYDPTDPTWSIFKVAQYSQCAGQLKIFGSVVAKQVHFDRSFGSYNNQTKPYNTTDAAEAIIYGPEMWLSSTPGGSSNYSAITGLPPIL